MEKTWKSTTGGILSTLCGSLNIIIGDLLIAYMVLYFDEINGSIFGPAFAIFIFVVAMMFIIFGVVSLLGGINALNRR